MIRCSAVSRYAAAMITPVVASAVAIGYVRKDPSSTRNSPTNPLVPGSAMDDSDTIVRIAANRGTTRAMPPYVDHADEKEQRARRDPVIDHDQQRALHTLQRQGPNAEHHEPEMRDRR